MRLAPRSSTCKMYGLAARHPNGSIQAIQNTLHSYIMM